MSTPRKSADDLPTLSFQKHGESSTQRLVAVWSGGTETFDLPASGTVTIGRGTEVDFRIEHASVSRRHATVVLDESGVRLEDLGSSNGTWVDGQRLAPNGSTTLRNGSVVELGAVLIVLRGGPAPATTEPEPKQEGERDLVVFDPRMREIHELVDLLAKSNLSVILLGETGVGKEVIASRIHGSSPRARAPFLKINCAALVESLLEAELFGHERGAFTGADRAKKGLLEAASGGTLFLDEVGELPLNIQAKLLRVLESGEVTRVGAIEPRKIDVRFVSATNRDLRELVAAGRFRQDLYFRLDGFSIAIPPLRERVAEIRELARAFVAEACVAHGKRGVVLSPDAEEKLVSYGWPGNVRELRNVIARSVLLCRGDAVEASDLRFEGMGPLTPSAAPPPAPSSSSVLSPTMPAGAPPAGDDERKRILEALEQSAGNQTRAAKLLGVSRRTLINRLDALGLPRPRK